VLVDLIVWVAYEGGMLQECRLIVYRTYMRHLAVSVRTARANDNDER